MYNFESHKYYDVEIDMYYLNSRYYNPQIGRFISSDALLGIDGDILSTNMYSYCQNNPISYVDPSGYLRVRSVVASVLIDIIIAVVAPYAYTYLAPLKAWNSWWGKRIAKTAFKGLKFVARKVCRWLWGKTLAIGANITMTLLLGNVNVFSIGGIIATIADIVTDKKLDGYITI